MIKQEKILKATTINHKYCDDCGVEIKMDMACLVARCELCGKDLCNKCVGHEDYNSGDYRIVYCSTCWNIGESYLKKIDVLEKDIEKLFLEWHGKCK